MKKILVTIGIIITGLISSFFLIKPKPIILKNPPAVTYFAEIDKDGNVLRVIVATQAVIDSGILGDSANWIESKQAGSIRKNPAAIGGKYDSAKDAFVPKDPQISGETFDATNSKWVLPTPVPFSPKSST